jgi:ZIP family zinc transporter
MGVFLLTLAASAPEAAEKVVSELSAGRVGMAALLSGLAASSLLVGTLLGLYARAPQRVIAAVMAFGSGALIQALAVDLAFEEAEQLVRIHAFNQIESWLWVAGGFVFGGVVYYQANQWIEKRGGHLRKPARMKAHLFSRYMHLPHALEHLTQVHVPHLHAPHLRQSGQPTMGQAAAIPAVPAMAAVPAVPMAMETRTEAEAEAAAAAVAMPELPKARAGQSLTPSVSMYEHGAEAALREEHEKAGNNAPVAIFMGALLDGIPESVVIGSSFVTLAAFSPTFLVAVFLSNLPEAMSSAAGMKRAGFSTSRIFGLWGGLVVASAVAAALGNLFLVGAPPTVLTLVQAIAGGGILAMLASTMMPEAFEYGGPSVGLSTIAGFLAAFYFTALAL